MPVSRLVDLIDISKKEMSELGLFAGIKGHIGDGNFHGNIIYNKQDPIQRHIVHEYTKKMDQRAIEMEGTCTGEHAIGWAKKDSLLLEVGQETVDVMVIDISHRRREFATLTEISQKSLKYALDSRWIL